MQPLTENSLNVPAFLNKLWKMVNDPKTDNLISWGQNGTTFVIQNKAQFWYELLPLYYKHNNMSSFVRQLNMYGFHKISSIDNTESSDKDELQFFHACFQHGKAELLRNIKRKVTAVHKETVSKGQTFNKDEITKFLTDVTQLKGRQQNVDSQLCAMKQENAVLWRELALLRQKHLQQQKIVNKLISFLVTLVQPSGRMGGLGPKRHYPLMINERPTIKKAKEDQKSESSDGPIIHELESVENDLLQEELLNDVTEPDFNQEMVVELLSDSEMPEEVCDTGSETAAADNKVFLNANTQDTLLSNLMNGNYNAKSVNDALLAGTSGTTPTASANKDETVQGQTQTTNEDENETKTVATRNRMRLARLSSVEDMDLHIEHTQSELESLKDILNPLLGGVQSVDANAFLGLFSDESPPYGLSYNADDLPKTDPMGLELMKYGNNLDFSQLFDEDSSDDLVPTDLPITAETLDETGSITTPQIHPSPSAPTFPKID